jgi:outer membrane protein assembly factor BamB
VEKALASPAAAEAALTRAVAAKLEAGYRQVAGPGVLPPAREAVVPEVGPPGALARPEPLWSTPPHSGTRRGTTLLVAAGLVIHVEPGEDAAILATDAATGELRWRSPWRAYGDCLDSSWASIDGPCTVADDLLLVPTARTIAALRLATGEIAWITATEEQLRIPRPATIALHEGAAWRTLGHRLVQASFGRSTFSSHFTIHEDGLFAGGPVADDTAFVLMVEDHCLGFTWDQPDHPAWMHVGHAHFGPHPVFAGERVILALWRPVAGIESALMAVDRSTGKALWLTVLGQQFPRHASAMAVAGDLVVVKETPGWLTCLSHVTGEARWVRRHTVDTAAPAALAIAGGAVYSMEGSGATLRLAVLDLATGHECHRLEPPARHWWKPITPVVADGRLYACTDQSLLAYAVAD